jgi:hypothetical protein
MGNGPSSQLDSDDEEDAPPPPSATEHVSKDHTLVTHMRAALEELLLYRPNAFVPEARELLVQMHRFLIVRHYKGTFHKEDVEVNEARAKLYQGKPVPELLHAIDVLFAPLKEDQNLRPRFKAFLKSLPPGPPLPPKPH